MSVASDKVAMAFRNGESKRVGHDHTDGNAVYYRGNKIVERREDGIWWSMAGWDTVTTRDRLRSNGIYVSQKNYVQMFNGEPVDAYMWYKL